MEKSIWDSKNFFESWTFINVHFLFGEKGIQTVFSRKSDCEHNAVNPEFVKTCCEHNKKVIFDLHGRFRDFLC